MDSIKKNPSSFIPEGRYTPYFYSRDNIQDGNVLFLLIINVSSSTYQKSSVKFFRLYFTRSDFDLKLLDYEDMFYAWNMTL